MTHSNRVRPGNGSGPTCRILDFDECKPDKEVSLSAGKELKCPEFSYTELVSYGERRNGGREVLSNYQRCFTEGGPVSLARWAWEYQWSGRGVSSGPTSHDLSICITRYRGSMKGRCSFVGPVVGEADRETVFFPRLDGEGDTVERRVHILFHSVNLCLPVSVLALPAKRIQHTSAANYLVIL